MTSLQLPMDNIFDSSGVLAEHLAGYIPRPGQGEMAEAVHRLLTRPRQEFALDGADCLVVEAETGLGKTLAYLIPAALSGRKVVISTNTKNLQDQILDREIPFIQKHIAPELQAMCIKGRQNYLCLYRYQQLHSEKQGSLFQTNKENDHLSEWIEETTYGDRAELSWLSSSSRLWQKICCLSHFCPGQDCPEHHRCFLNRLRRDAARCNLLIVNHHLLFSDLAVRKNGYGEVLPRYEAIIFDEAHHVENVATTFFGHSFSKYQVIDLIGDLERSGQSLAPGERKKLLAHTVALNMATETLSLLFPQEKGRFPLDQFIQQKPTVETAVNNVLAAFEPLITLLDTLRGGAEPWEQYGNRCHELSSRLSLITADIFNDLEQALVRYTHWFERSEKNLSLFATPIDISDELQTTLFSSVAACVFTSATLTTGNSFNYFFSRMGLAQDTETLSYGSPFDYGNRTLLYIPQQGFPEPASPSFQNSSHEQIQSLITASGGRALVLFTSFKSMESAYYQLKESIPHPLLMQGEAPRHILLNEFSQVTDSVLFAVSSFWEGVDVPGKSLSLVIIEKLPFEVPSDPVIMARINRIKADGGNPFFDFQVPRAILSLRQGVGRLMRTIDDQGVIAILDARLFSKGYGKRFLKSLPPSPLTRELQQVTDFFHKL